MAKIAIKLVKVQHFSYYEVQMRFIFFVLMFEDMLMII
ncbi:hypothetical protein HC081234_02520 [Helicobacter cinaedi]|nr:hypothetical protein HC081234_02520 [Helicobacter cinaedi]